MRRKYVIIIIIIVLFIICLIGCAKTEPQDIEETTFRTVTPSFIATPDSESEMSAIKPSKSTVNPEDDYSIDNTQIPEDTMLINELTNGQKGLFYLGMIKDDVITVFESYGIKNYDTTEITNDKDDWDQGNYVTNVMIYGRNFQFFFDKQSTELYYVNVSGRTATSVSTTQAGLKLGDSFDQMVKLYGNDYTVYKTEDDGTFYEYKTGNEYFRVCVLFDNVFRWGISEYKFDKE